MLKEITPTFATINSVSISGTTQVVSSTTTISYKDSVAVQFVWSGNLQGVATIDGSLNYSSGLPQSGAQANQGDWTSLAFTPGVTTINVGSSTLFPVLVNMNQLAFPYMRITFTNSTGSGLLTAYVMAKSLG